MPELPEVQTTVNGLRRRIVGLTIKNVWSDYASAYFKGSNTIKDSSYFKYFKKQILEAKIVAVDRRAKNILIRLHRGAKNAEKIILVHMKMTGHLLYGTYRFDARAKRDPWIPIEPESLKDPYNRHVHLMFTFSNGNNLALSDVRTFAKVTLLESTSLHHSEHTKDLGPEPLERSFTYQAFKDRVGLKPRRKIKQVLMDQSVIAGIGNIYADESLWRAGVHPLRLVSHLSDRELRLIYKAIRTTLSRGIDFGGDSTSDYRNVDGNKGRFHEGHRAYQRTGTRCDRRGCGGTIRRMVMGGRSTHYCDRHQRLSVKQTE